MRDLTPSAKRIILLVICHVAGSGFRSRRPESESFQTLALLDYTSSRLKRNIGDDCWKWQVICNYEGRSNINGIFVP